jgi:peroxiredoxin Q/BCP
VTAVKPGSKAPAFTLPRDGGGTLSLGDFKGRKVVFSGLKAAFARADTDIVGVSADSVKAQDKFRDKHGLKVALASDETKKMLTDYGVWGEKSMYGRKFMGVRRTTLLIDRDGRIAQMWENVKVPGHADEVLAAAKAL